jgi:hypothetical protein
MADVRGIERSRCAARKHPTNGGTTVTDEVWGKFVCTECVKRGCPESVRQFCSEACLKSAESDPFHALIHYHMPSCGAEMKGFVGRDYKQGETIYDSGVREDAMFRSKVHRHPKDGGLQRDADSHELRMERVELALQTALIDGAGSWKKTKGFAPNFRKRLVRESPYPSLATADEWADLLAYVQTFAEPFAVQDPTLEGLCIHRSPISNLRHSCFPNAGLMEFPSGNRVMLVAINDIKAGDEVCISYDSILVTLVPKTERRIILKDTFGIMDCKCVRCSNPDDPIDKLLLAEAPNAPANAARGAIYEQLMRDYKSPLNRWTESCIRFLQAFKLPDTHWQAIQIRFAIVMRLTNAQPPCDGLVLEMLRVLMGACKQVLPPGALAKSTYAAVYRMCATRLSLQSKAPRASRNNRTLARALARLDPNIAKIPETPKDVPLVGACPIRVPSGGEGPAGGVSGGSEKTCS